MSRFTGFPDFDLVDLPASAPAWSMRHLRTAQIVAPLAFHPPN